LLSNVSKGTKRIIKDQVLSCFWTFEKKWRFFTAKSFSESRKLTLCLFFCADWLFDRWMFLLHPIDIEVYPPHPDTFSNRMRVTRIHFQSYPGDPDTWPPGYNLEGLEIVSAYPQDRRLPPPPPKSAPNADSHFTSKCATYSPSSFFSPISVNNHKREFLFSWKRFKKTRDVLWLV